MVLIFPQGLWTSPLKDAELHLNVVNIMMFMCTARVN